METKIINTPEEAIELFGDGSTWAEFVKRGYEIRMVATNDSEPEWTSEVPTDSGWYWCRDSERPTTTKEVCWIDCEDYAQVPGEEFWTEPVEEPE